MTSPIMQQYQHSCDHGVLDIKIIHHHECMSFSLTDSTSTSIIIVQFSVIIRHVCINCDQDTMDNCTTTFCDCKSYI